MSTVHPGDVLAGKYRVERVLGSGGMGYVVAARHLQLDQLVAMKFLRKSNRGTLDETEATGRFLREAKAVVRLKDEHVAKVFDVGTLDTGEPYIVMEYLDGADLSAIAKQRGQLPIHEAVEYIMQCCEGLAEAHSLGIVHRDVKLANLFVTRGHAGSPLVKVLDFGISKVNPFGESEHDMTRTSSMLGSPRFMSPEQMRDARAVDARSDLWSLGVVLYRLVAGRPPFEAETLGRLLTMVMHESPDPLSSVLPDLPPGFSETVGRCLEKEASARFANVAELAYALVPYAADPLRARASADRAAATLSVAQMPRSGEIPFPTSSSNPMLMPMSRPSSPGQSDTGTAAPWAGTHGGGSRRRDRNLMLWVAMAIVAMLGAGLIALKISDSRARAAASLAAAAQHQTGTAGVAGVAGQPGIVVADTAVSSPGSAPQVTTGGNSDGLTFDSNGVAITPIASPNLLPRASDSPRGRVTAGSSRKPAGHPASIAPAVAAPPTAAVPAPIKNGEGIPSTRD